MTRHVSFLVFADLAAPRSPAANDLVRAFGLTSSKAKLAALVAEPFAGGDRRTARAITLMTARNQLRAIFAKIETHRQSEFVALLARLAAR